MKNQKIYVRNFIFGVEDSLVSTVGLLSGIAIANVPKPTIILTGIILIFVEAFSMGAGSYLSEYITHSEKDPKRKMSSLAGIIMLISYMGAGLIPLSPYIFFEGRIALILSTSFSLLALIALGIVSSILSKTNSIKNTIRMFLLGGSAIAVGIVVSSLIQ
jgi:VIT1/CCC1 family predicted Fe2+/Mn2+ transporter